MNTMQIPDLDDNGRSRWRKEMESLLDLRGVGQKSIADAIAESLGEDMSTEDLQIRAQNRHKPEVSLFVNGDPKTMQRWFRARDNPKIQAFARALGVTPDDLLVILERSASGVTDGSWHPAFPGVRLGQVEIPPAFVMNGDWKFSDQMDYLFGPKETARPDVLAKATSLIAEALGNRRPLWAWVVGPAGSGRHSLVHLLARELQRATGRLPSWTIRDQEPPEGWATARAACRGVEVAIVERLPRGREEDVALHLRPWSAREIGTVIDVLSRLNVFDPTGERTCREFLERLATEPEFLGDSAWPVQVIEVLADTARLGKVRNPQEVRAAKTRAAWMRACRTRDAAGILEGIEETVLDRYFAGLFADGPVSPWTRIPTTEAVDRLETACRGVPQRDIARPVIERLLDRLSEAGRPDRRLLDEARRELARPTGTALLSALLAGGLLRKEGDTVEAIDESLALLWAARGLDTGGFRLERWERLFEYGWHQSAREIGLAHRDPLAVGRVLAEAPPWAAADRDRWFVVFLAHNPRAIPHASIRGTVLPAWASCIWTTLHGTFEAEVACNFKLADSMEPLHRTVQALRKISFRYQGGLPELAGTDLEAELATHVSADVRKFAEDWWPRSPEYPTTPFCTGYSSREMGGFRKPTGRWVNPMDWAEDSRDFKSTWIQLMAPAQHLPLEPALAPLRKELDWFRRCTEGQEILQSADAGNEAARAFVAGSPLFADDGNLDPELLARWQTIPAAGRLKWIGHAGKKATGPKALSNLLSTAAGMPETPLAADEILDCLSRLPIMVVGPWLRGSLSTKTRVPKGLVPLGRNLALRTAERLRLATVLEVAADTLEGAEALHRAGRPDALRALWRTGPEELRSRAAEELLSLADDTPLLDWAADDAVTLPENVAAMLASDPAILDRAWSVAGRTGRREALLELAAAESEDDSLPRPWVFEASRNAPARFRRELAVRHRAVPKVLPLLRELWAGENPGSRARAYWAVLQNSHRWGAPEVEATLKEWVFEDAYPFSGSPAFQESGVESPDADRRISGGWGWLLTILGETDPASCPWLVEAVSRLWTIRLRDRGPAAEVLPDAVLPVLATQEGLCWGPERILLDLLERFGMGDRVLEALDAREAPPASGDDLPYQVLRWWRTRASDEDIEAMLQANDWRADQLETVLWEAGDARAAKRLFGRLETSDWDDINPLPLRLSCESLPDVVSRAAEILIRRFPERRRAILFLIAYADEADISASTRQRGHESLRRILREATFGTNHLGNGGDSCPAR